MAKSYEKVKFKLIQTPCCGHLLCWVNPRYPSYCPCCGVNIFAEVKRHVMHSDDEAILELDFGRTN